VVADPTGLVEIDPISGMQRIASEPLASGHSLQLVWDSPGDAFVLAGLVARLLVPAPRPSADPNAHL
jgi:hypothetical protein